MAWIWVAVACLAFGALRPLAATTMVYQSTLELLQASELVIVGEVTAIRYEERGGQIVTVITVRVAETWKGEAAGAAVEIVEPGGIIGDRGARTSGIPRYQKGDRVVSFLEKNKAGPGGGLRTTGGVPGRHLVIDAPPVATPGAPAQPMAILARPNSDADCDYAGHDEQGLTVLVGFPQMMRLEAAQKTTLDQFRAEVAAYQKALDAGQTPPLSARDQAIAAGMQAFFQRGHTHDVAGAVAPVPPAALAATTATAGNPPAAHPAGPFVVLREEDVERIMRERREQTRDQAAAQDQTKRWAWIVFALSGAAFVGLTVLLRRRRALAAVDKMR